MKTKGQGRGEWLVPKRNEPVGGQGQEETEGDRQQTYTGRG
jgi:hypothetical protein